MSDCMDFSCGPSSACVEGPCFSGECWSPGFDSSVCCSPSSSTYEFSAMRSSSSLDMNTSSLYGSSVGDSTVTQINSSKSASELVQDGSFIQSNRTPRLDQGERSLGEQPKVVVTTDASVTPDYIVRQDGKVEVVGNPDAGDKANGLIRIQVEAGASQKATDDLVKYVNDRIKQKEPGAEPVLHADPGLVSEEISRLFAPKPASPDENTPEDATPPDDDYSPSDPGGGGDCPSNPDNDNYPDERPNDSPEDSPFPEQDSFVPTGPMDSILDAARLNTWENNSHGSLGAYEINAFSWFSSWLDDEMLAELGDPPDFKKLAKVLAKHKNNPKFKAAMDSRLDNMKEQGDTAGAEKIEGLFNRLANDPDSSFAENFGIFLNSQMPGGRNATGEEMNNYFDKDMQKAIASSRMADIAKEANVKIKDLAPEQAARMALAGALGKVPSEQDLQNYSQYLQVVLNRYKPARTRA